MSPTNSKHLVVEQLSKLLASSHALQLKTQNFHWNVTGRMFTTLHTLFEGQYSELSVAIDEIAERIRSLGHLAPGSYSTFSKMSVVQEENGHPNAEEMIQQLVLDQERLTELSKKIISLSESDDQASADLATKRLEVHEKNIWMLRSHLE